MQKTRLLLQSLPKIILHLLPEKVRCAVAARGSTNSAGLGSVGAMELLQPVWPEDEDVALSKEENSLSFVNLNILLKIRLLDHINNLWDLNLLNVLSPDPHKMSLTEIVQK